MDYKIILASNSPRRKELLAGLGIDFEVKVISGIDESYPDNIPVEKVAEYIASQKAIPYYSMILSNELVITADTVVVCDDEIFGKPNNDDDAYRMLRQLSGKTHHVITGVCMTSKEKQRIFSVTTEVSFKELSDEEINYYIKHEHPMDKAGAYGIQEWIGYIGCVGLKGSYYNVMGLPVQRIYEELKLF